jgi:hypothetical protein
VNREEFEATHDGMTYDQVWRRSKCEMALIRQEGREAELSERTHSEVHALAGRILDEQIAAFREEAAAFNARR